MTAPVAESVRRRNHDSSLFTRTFSTASTRCRTSADNAQLSYSPARAVACLSGNRNSLDSLQRGSGAYARNGRDPAVDQEVCPDDVRRIVRREVNCQLCDFQRIDHPLAWIVGSENVLNRVTLLFARKATDHRRVHRAWA